MDIIEVTGTISTIYPTESDSTGFLSQKLIINNAHASSTSVPLGETQLLISCRSLEPIEFTLNTPITAKGNYTRGNSNFMGRIHNVRAPLGYLRYNGKVYR